MQSMLWVNGVLAGLGGAFGYWKLLLIFLVLAGLAGTALEHPKMQRGVAIVITAVFSWSTIWGVLDPPATQAWTAAFTVVIAGYGLYILLRTEPKVV
jgi:hypothetical protein